MPNTTTPQPKPTAVRRSALATLLATLSLLAAPAASAVPMTAQLEGVLTATGGLPAADGEYEVTVTLHAGVDTKDQLWSEGPVKVQVQGGRFSLAIGANKSLDAAVLAAGDRWLGVQVGSEPQLPRQPLRSAPYAVVAGAVGCVGCVSADQLANGAVSGAKLGVNYAGSNSKAGPALDLSCTGCVSVSELKFDGDVDLGGNSIKAKNGTFSGDVVAKTITATAFVGDGSKLTGVKLPAASCGAGKVVTGIAADGSLVCGAGAAALPADGLGAVSNGTLDAVYDESVSITTPQAIPDNTGSDLSLNLVVPDWGKAKTFTVTVKLSNSDPSTVRLRLLPPDDKKVGYTLCDPCGDGQSQTVTLTFPTPDKVKSGDLGAWIGKSPAGTWTLDVTDSKFCLPQVAPKLCSLENKTDGAVEHFEIAAKVLASSKVAAKATLQLQAGLMHTVATKEPRPCDASAKGFTYFDDTRKALRICNGQEWFDLYVQAPGSKSNPAESCKALLTLSPQSKSGVYWLDPDGPGGTAPFEALCDMETDGGGWTLVGTVYGGDANNWNTQYGYWSDSKALGNVKSPFVDYKSPAWWTVDTSKAEVLFERRYDGKLKAQVKLDAACQKGKATFNALFTSWDTNLKCGTGSITVVTAPADAAGVSGDSYREGQSSGLGGSGTNGWCWNGGDNNSNTFKGHAGWNQSGYGCLDAGHLSYIGVWQKGNAQYSQIDIDTTNWQTSATVGKTAVSFWVR